ncbi:hypothetical protein [Vogesella sp. XCS3]|uniref:hypothetical protein n=1 Tax=Vogesella sp. XCS3 TaxID=2877939 RepID=UPI001D09A8F4|nr:hypothetical protein [Vogesella sp. XCS3]UDM18873.1 hypothetical protein LCH97_18560 [Vogesella sp. XCS3]
MQDITKQLDHCHCHLGTGLWSANPFRFWGLFEPVDLGFPALCGSHDDHPFLQLLIAVFTARYCGNFSLRLLAR